MLANQYELLAYCGVVAFGLCHLIWHGYNYSLQFEAGAPWDGYAPGLRHGWLFGRRVDLSDDQWRDFRSSLPLLAASMSAFVTLSQIVRQSTGHKATQRAKFYIAVSLFYLFFLHGFCLLYVVLLALASYKVTNKVAGTKHGAAIIWAFHILMLLIVRIFEGFPFSAFGLAFAWLDDYRGNIRWHICFNLTMLRMLSYAMDLHWAKKERQRMTITPNTSSHDFKFSTPPRPTRAAPPDMGTPTLLLINSGQGGSQNITKMMMDDSPPDSKDAMKPSNINLLSPSRLVNGVARDRQRTALPADYDYSLVFFLAHTLYLPLYIAGPIITYHDFVWQLKQQEVAEEIASIKRNWRFTGADSFSENLQRCAKYGTRLIADLVCIEILTHTLYFNSLAKHRIGMRYQQHGLEYGPQEIGMTGWWVLTFMWLKFATIWRTFRLIALADGIEAPENMVRCFADNYDVEGFWRGWHASFNRWLVRYLYVPIGGTKRKLLAVWVTFLFVALWHDLEWHLIGWASLICLAFVPEILIKRWAATSPKLAEYRQTAAYTHVCALAAAINIAALMSANLAGFVVGIGGLKQLFVGLAASPLYVMMAFTSFYCAAHILFVLREHKIGINQ